LSFSQDIRQLIEDLGNQIRLGAQRIERGTGSIDPADFESLPIKEQSVGRLSVPAFPPSTNVPCS
jgi:hypothetical protein